MDLVTAANIMTHAWSNLAGAVPVLMIQGGNRLLSGRLLRVK